MRKARAGEHWRRWFLALAIMLALQGVRAQSPSPIWDNLRSLIEGGHYEKAERELRSFLKDQPNVAHAHYLLGMVAGKRKDYLQSVSALQSALRIAPGAVDYRIALAGVYAEMGNLDAGEAELRRVLKAAPNHLQAHYWLAYYHYMRKQDVSARKELEECLRLDPKHLPSLLLAGDLLYSANDHPAALQRYLEAQAVMPTRNGYFGLARIYSFNADQSPAAIECLNRILERKTGDLDALSLAASVYSQMGEKSKAEWAYREVLKQNPSAEDALVSLGRLLARTGRVEEGDQFLKRGTEARKQKAVLEDRQRAVRTALFEADNLAKQKHFDGALAKVGQVLQTDRDLSDAWALRARILLFQGDGSGASSAITEAIRLSPFYGGNYYLLGLIEESRHNPQAALAAFEKALAADPQSKEAEFKVRTLLAK